jgi:hypothetical protein
VPREKQEVLNPLLSETVEERGVVVSVNLGKDRIMLGTSLEIRREMAGVYKRVRRGELPLKPGTQLINMLKIIREAKTDEEKIHALRQAGVPFTGITIVAPPEDKKGEKE